MLEEEDHQLEGRGVEAKEEVLQDLLLCSMCRNDHYLGYVISSDWCVVYVACGAFILAVKWPLRVADLLILACGDWLCQLPGHNLGMWCLYFSVLSCDRDMRNLMRLLWTLTLWCRYYAYILSGSFFNSAETERTWEAKPRVQERRCDVLLVLAGAPNHLFLLLFSSAKRGADIENYSMAVACWAGQPARCFLEQGSWFQSFRWSRLESSETLNGALLCHELLSCRGGHREGIRRTWSKQAHQTFSS